MDEFTYFKQVWHKNGRVRPFYTKFEAGDNRGTAEYKIYGCDWDAISSSEIDVCLMNNGYFKQGRYELVKISREDFEWESIQ